MLVVLAHFGPATAMAAPNRRRSSRDSGAVQSVKRALELIDALQRVESAEVGELADLHGVHRSTTLRLLQTLERFGYVTRGQNRGEFRLGLRLLELGLAASEQNELLGAARPVMHDLAEATGETIDLTLCEDGEMLMLESVAARPFGRVGIDVGRRVAAPGTTAGKLRLAALPARDAEQIVGRHGLPRIGPKSITDPNRYLAELQLVRSTGYAVNDEETDAGVRFVGVRVDLPVGGARPALVLGAPKHRLRSDDYPRIAALLAEAARRIAASVA
jgi:IclR family transcriptional regulator, acetate operon repressor